MQADYSLQFGGQDTLQMITAADVKALKPTETSRGVEAAAGRG